MTIKLHNTLSRSTESGGAVALRAPVVAALHALVAADDDDAAVVTAEESYTSKASFVDNDVLRVYGETKQGNAAEVGASGTPSPAVAYSGRRCASDRNWFNRHNAGSGRLSRLHADVNGAFNIIRKVFSRFCYHAGLSLKFNVRRISPRLGAVTLLSPTG
ncbi:hypothetical protein GOB57_09145 [Sinorhizobium meliloti]|nr:hypothetical protein [Sinorhizobium meliloti]